MPLNFSGIQIGERYDRPTLARIWGYQGHEAISRGVVTPKGGSQIVLFVTRIKQATFTQFKDYISGDLLFWEGETGHGSDERIVSAKSRGEAVHLFFREIHHSPFEYKGEVEFLRREPRPPEPSRLFVFQLLNDQGPDDDLRTHSNEIEAAPFTEWEALQKSRVGQGRFREYLLDYWQGRCAVSGLPVPELLRASHIKPWRVSNNPERLDRFNGLLLLPQYDALFDKGWISFADDRSLLVSKVVSNGDLSRLGIQASDKLEKLDPRHQPYLEYHREKIFWAEGFRPGSRVGRP